MRILSKLREWIRNWLGVDEKHFRTDRIEVYASNGETQSLAIVEVVGLTIRCQNRISERVITETDAVDPRHFWYIVRKLGQPMKWADGTDYQFPEFD